jgi:hypothetical protein
LNVLENVAKKVLRRAGDRYVHELVKREYSRQAMDAVNERPIEYSFVFECIARCRPESALDVGTGDSSLPSLIRHCGPTVDAIDYTDGYWGGYLNNRHWYVQRHNIATESLEKRYGLVTCISVIEHIPEASSAVHNMLGVLSQTGSLIITCPYTEHRYIDDVYPLIGVRNRYICRSYSRREVDEWVISGFQIAEQQYWQLFSGEFWRSGERLSVYKRTGPDQPHQLTCLRIARV